MAYQCSVCGKVHADLPHMGTDRPDAWWAFKDHPEGHRVELTEDTCILDHDYFIRGVVEIPIIGQKKPFGFGVWVTQKRENFETYLANPQSSEIGPFFGWLATEISAYPVRTALLKTMAHFRGGGLRPSIELEPTDHPLAVEQRTGITVERAWEIVHFYDHSAR